MDEIKVGDRIKTEGMPDELAAEVLEIVPCDEGLGSHPAYRIKDPGSGEDDVVCSYQDGLVKA